MNGRWWRLWRLWVAALAVGLLPSALAAQNGNAAERPLATRAELEDAKRGGSDAARIRLAEGDFRRGDQIVLEVQAESLLTDTFTVGGQSELLLPPPTVGTLSLRGVLRSELQDKMTEYIARFRQNPVVRAYPLIRISVQGEVLRGGVYAVPADGRLSDALMAAGGATQYAKTNKMYIERGGKRVWEGTSFETTLDELGLRNGDQIVVGGNRPSGGTDVLRMTALIVSIAGGIYGLSRAF